MKFKGVLKAALGVTFATIACIEGTQAQTNFPELIVAPDEAPAARVVISEDPFTVLIMAPDGSWGVTTSVFIGEAFSGAMAQCKLMSGPKLGCGYASRTIRAGWVLGIRCGTENILVADRILANAELAAINRERELRQLYGKDLSSCVRVVTVDPDGAVFGRSSAAPAKSRLQQGGVELVQ